MKRVISTDGLTKNFEQGNRTIEAIKDLSLGIDKGDFVGLIGLNGAGKTTLLKMLAGIMSPTSGEVQVLGENPLNRSKKFLSKIAFVMGNKNQLWWELTPQDSFYLTSKVYGVKDKVYKDRLEILTKLFEISPLIDKQVRNLSLGERMRCEIVNSLLYDPDILFLDEPTIGLDIVMQKRVRSYLFEYNANYKTTIIMTSHDMGDVESLCRRLLVLDKGSLIYDGDIKRLVGRFAPEKRVEFESDMEVDSIEVGETRFSRVVGNLFRGELSKDEVNSAVSELLNKYRVGELSIKEVSLEDVVARIYSS